MKELALWQKLRHPNIVQFLGVLKQSDRLIFLTEYLRNVSLDILMELTVVWLSHFPIIGVASGKLV